MINLHIGGVPEHFNLPWYLALRNKEFLSEGINLRWKDYHGGTGQMCSALRSGEIDMAVILTEGIIRDIIEGNECKIVQVFVKTPLIWGVHVFRDSKYQTMSDIRGSRAAISRYGSGSHLMAYVNAEREQWNLKQDLIFKVVRDLDGALMSLPKGEGDYFMWEKFTTKPYVDNGPFRLIGECPTPWPCFVIAVRDEVLKNNEAQIQSILEIINRTTINFKQIPNIDKMISERYGQILADVQKWLSMTEWSQENLTTNQIETIQNQLLKLKLIKNKVPATQLLHIFQN